MTTSPFRTKIREKIADNTLQAALDANAKRRIEGRATALESLPDWRDRRRRAHAIRADVISRLDEYLGQFTAKLLENGFTIHRAQDAAEARKITLEIINSSAPKNSADQRRAASRLIAKSKSMVSEEIELNHALEKAGHRVVETDLGEYIIQLRGERPSHIITPAVHLRRQEVGQLFAEKLGIPYTEDIPTLTNTARKILRDVFLSADVGVSGVNFGVAESGTLTLVTNEGNGRMVTTLPPVHIALMGMERLVPTLKDLALMLSLLPRSATGQKISVYTQFIQRPEKGQQRHIIIVDNGRSDLRDSPLRESLYCIRCGACLNACPVFRELGGHAYVGTDGSIAPYPGPIGSIVSPGLIGENYVQLAQASSLCGACKDACPVDIDLPMLLTRVRAGSSPYQLKKTQPQGSGAGLPQPVKTGMQLFTHLSAYPGLFALSQRAIGLGARVVSPLSQWMKLPALTGWGYSKDFPRPALKPFRARFKGAENQGCHNPIASSSRHLQSPNPLTDDIHPANVPTPNPVKQFIEELSALGGHVQKASAPEVFSLILAVLQERGINRIQVWDEIPGLAWQDFNHAGVQIQREADETLKAGITGALAGIAETGTLVIPSSEEQPLTASLLPEIHIAVLRACDIEESLVAVFASRKVTDYPGIVLISGPSRTADIEMTLTIGVHGPGELFVFITTE